MSVSKAQQRATAKYIKNNYDELKIRVPKGDKEKIKNHISNNNESINSFVIRAINETIEKDNNTKNKGG